MERVLYLVDWLRINYMNLYQSTILGDIPILGQVFRYNEDVDDKLNLVIILTLI